MILGNSDFGIGTDIESINRFENLDIKKDAGFLHKIFTEKELDYCFSKSNPAQHLTARFSGKEAVIKALSSINKENIPYNHIEIINNEKGIPLVELNSPDLNCLNVKLSLSHCEDKAVAYALVAPMNFED